MAQIQIRDTAGAPLTRINIRIAEGDKPSDEAIFDYDTDLAGNKGWPIPHWPVMPYTLHVNFADVDPRYEALSVYVPAPASGEYENIGIVLPRVPDTEPIPEPGLFPPEQGKLRIEDDTFKTEDNQLWQWRGYSWFLGFLRYCRGEDITSDLRWMRANGINLVRVFGPLPWNETADYRPASFTPERFAQLDAFFGVLEAHGLRCEYVPICMAFDLSQQRALVQQSYDVAARHWNVLIEVANEPHVNDTDPVAIMQGVDRRGVLSAYGLYGGYYKSPAVTEPTLDYVTIHVQRDSGWHRKARHAQELQHSTGKPCISDEPAKLTEPGFSYPGGKNDPVRTPAEAAWHFGICSLWTPGGTVHTEEGKWGRVPTAGMLQLTSLHAVRDHVWLKMPAEWQLGKYNGSHMSSSPVDFIRDIWTYTSLHPDKALSIRCAFSAPQPTAGWVVVDRWGPNGSFVTLRRA